MYSDPFNNPIFGRLSQFWGQVSPSRARRCMSFCGFIATPQCALNNNYFIVHYSVGQGFGQGWWGKGNGLSLPKVLSAGHLGGAMMAPLTQLEFWWWLSAGMSPFSSMCPFSSSRAFSSPWPPSLSEYWTWLHVKRTKEKLSCLFMPSLRGSTTSLLPYFFGQCKSQGQLRLQDGRIDPTPW